MQVASSKTLFTYCINKSSADFFDLDFILHAP